MPSRRICQRSGFRAFVILVASTKIQIDLCLTEEGK